MHLSKFFDTLLCQILCQVYTMTYLFIICDWICEEGLARIIINILKCKFEMFFLRTYRAACMQFSTILQGIWIRYLMNS